MRRRCAVAAQSVRDFAKAAVQAAIFIAQEVGCVDSTRHVSCSGARGRSRAAHHRERRRRKYLCINDVSQFETDAGTTTFTFTVTLDAPAGPSGVTFDIATANGTASDRRQRLRRASR